MFDTGDYINIVLALITLGTIFYARRTLLASDSPRLVIENYSQKRHFGVTDGFTFELVLQIKNFGRGVAPKTYLILILDGEKKQYYLSKPITSLEPGNTGEINIKLRVGHDGELSEFTANFLEEYGIKGAYLVTQDFFGEMYYSKVNSGKGNNHLKGFDKPITKVYRYGIMKRRIKFWFRRAVKQQNTYPDREKRARDKKWESDMKKFNLNDLND